MANDNMDYILPREEKALARMLTHGKASKAGQEVGFGGTGPNATSNANRNVAAILRDKGVQNYFWERTEEVGLYLDDVLRQLMANMFESELRIFDFKSGEVVSLGPDTHERNRAIEIYLRAMTMMGGGNAKDIKIKNKVVINYWGDQPVNPDGTQVIDVTAQEVRESIDEIIDGDWDDDDDGD